MPSEIKTSAGCDQMVLCVSCRKILPKAGMARDREGVRMAIVLRRKTVNGLFCKDCQIK